jgi:ComF family protein
VRRIARVGTFGEPLVTLIHRLKFGRSWEVARVLAPFMHHAISRVAEEVKVPVDVLVPVPLHWMRRARRGFNQAEELAREAGRLGGWRVIRPLRRVRRTAEQARIDAPSRRAENLQGAFSGLPDRRLRAKHVWIVDDVSTTGATIHAAATALRKLPEDCRPASINAAVVCVTDHGSPPARVEILG